MQYTVAKDNAELNEDKNVQSRQKYQLTGYSTRTSFTETGRVGELLKITALRDGADGQKKYVLVHKTSRQR